MEIDVNQLIHSAFGSSWLVPVLGFLGWGLVKFLDGKFTTVQTFNNYVTDVEKKLDELKDEQHADMDRLDNYIQVVDKKAQQNGKDIARVEGRLESS